jgi:ABC-type antimicrobial peptide transport system permease subunit
VLFDGNMEVTSTTEFFLELDDSGTSLLNALVDGVGDNLGASLVVSLLGLSNVESVEDCLSFLWILCFLSKSMIQQDVTSLCFNIFNTVLGQVRHLDEVGVCSFGECLNLFLLVGVELVV